MDQQHAYQLTEHLMRSTTPLSLESKGSRQELLGHRTSSPSLHPPLVSPLPSNAVIFHPTTATNANVSGPAADTSFHDYIDRQFQQGASTLKSHLQSPAPVHSPTALAGEEEEEVQEDEKHPHPVDGPTNDPHTLWAVIQNDLHQVKKYNNVSESDIEANNYHRHPQYATQQEIEEDPRPWWTWDKEDGMYSIGMFLFLFGFLFPPCWWLGSFWPQRPERGGKMAKRWQQLNRYLSIGFSIVVVILIIVVAAIYSTSPH